MYGNNQTGAASSDTKTDTPVTNALAFAHQLAENAIDAAANLEDRISPVVRQQSEKSPGSVEPAQATSCSMEDALNGLNNKLHRINLMLNSLRNRVAL